MAADLLADRSALPAHYDEYYCCNTERHDRRRHDSVLARTSHLCCPAACLANFLSVANYTPRSRSTTSEMTQKVRLECDLFTSPRCLSACPQLLSTAAIGYSNYTMSSLEKASPPTPPPPPSKVHPMPRKSPGGATVGTHRCVGRGYMSICHNVDKRDVSQQGLTWTKKQDRSLAAIQGIIEVVRPVFLPSSLRQRLLSATPWCSKFKGSTLPHGFRQIHACIFTYRTV